MAGKCAARRPYNDEKYGENYDKIFRKKEKSFIEKLNEMEKILEESESNTNQIIEVEENTKDTGFSNTLNNCRDEIKKRLEIPNFVWDKGN